MALRQCFSRGRKGMLTILLPRTSTQCRHLFSVGFPERTQRWNSGNINILTNAHPKSASSCSTKWQDFKTLSCNYSKTHKGTEFLKSSEVDDDDVDDESDSSDNNNSHIDNKRIISQVEDIFANKKEMTSAEWEETIRLMSLGNSLVTVRSCDAITMKTCLRHGNYSLATSYMEHLQRQGGEPNASTLGNYLQLCGEHVAQCGEDRVLESYHKLMSQVKMLDLRLVRNVILGLSATREWRLALDHLPQFKKMSDTCQLVYSSVITAAFRTGDYELGWQYYAALRQMLQTPQDSVFLEWVRQCDAVEDKAEKEAMALTLLQQLETQEVYLSVAVVKAVTQLFRESLGWSAHFLKVPKSGACPACKHQLDTNGVSEEEFRNLQEEFVPRVLVRSDIFRSTSPEEWSHFQRFVEERKPYSVVLDGLNASYIMSKKNAAVSSRQKSLQEVVQQALVEYPGGRVLVLGRQHMEKWSAKLRWNKQRVDVYTLNNMSKDDGFFLYAALQSGLGTKFVTSDMLRDHLFRMGEGPLRDAFRRWQRTHQVMAYSSAGYIRLRSPAKFSTVAQASQAGGVGVWHVPYDDGAPRQSYEVPLTWLCLHPSLTLAPRLPLSVSREPLTYNGSGKPFSPSLHVLHHPRVPSKDNQAGDRVRVGYKTSARGMTKQQHQQHGEEVAAYPRLQKYSSDVSSRNPPPRFPSKSQNKGLVIGKGRITSEVNLSTIFTQTADSSE